MPSDLMKNAQEENLRLLGRIREFNVLPGSELMQAMNISERFIGFWDESMHLIDANDSCLNCCMDAATTKDEILGLSLFYLFPDILPEDITRIWKQGGTLVYEDYQLKSPPLNNDVHLYMSLGRIDDYMIMVGTDITELLAMQSQFDDNLERLNKAESDQERLNNSLNELIVSLEERSEEIIDGYKRNVDQLLSPLFSALEQSAFTDDQRQAIRDAQEELALNTSGEKSEHGEVQHGLTQRELEVARLVKRGKTTKEIARTLCVSTKTVDTHRANIRHKLGLSSESTSLYQYLNEYGL